MYTTFILLAAHGGVAVGVASQEGSDVHQVGLEDEDVENHYHLLSYEEQGGEQSDQELRDEDIENHYHLVGSEQEDKKNGQETMNSGDKNLNYLLDHKEQHKSTSQGEGIESDYYLLDNEEEEGEQEREESVYHILEMPGDDDNDYEDPDEGNLFQDYDQKRREKSKGEPCAYEVPVTS